MTVREKVLAFIGLTTLALICAIVLVLYFVLWQSFETLEEQTVLRDVNRVLSELSNRQENLTRKIADYAMWNDTVEFIATGDPAYVRSNLVDTTFEQLGASVFGFFDLNGIPVYLQGFDLNTNRKIDVPESLRHQLEPGSRLLAFSGEEGVNQGLLQLPEGLMMISSRPILTSEGEGPIRGTVVIGRFIDPDYIVDMEQTTQLKIRLMPKQASALPRAAVLSKLSGSQPIYVQVLNRQLISGHVFLNDVYGGPATVLRVTMPREVTIQGRRAIIVFVTLICLSALVLGIGNLFFQNRVVLSRLADLNDTVTIVGQTGNLSRRIRVEGHDELANLADNINTMMSTLEKYQRDIVISEERYRNLVEYSPDLIYAVDEKGRLISVNSAGVRMLEYDSADQLIGTPFFWYIHPDDREMVFNAINQAFSSSDLHMSGVVFRMIKSSGLPIWSEINSKLVVGEGPGGSIMVGSVRDFTERKRAEEALYESERRLAEIIDFFPDAMFVIDRAGRVIAWNRSLEEMTGYSADRMLGKTEREYALAFYGEHRTMLIDQVLDPSRELEEVFEPDEARGNVILGQVYIPNLLGEEAYLLVAAVGLRNANGELVGAIESLRDITRIKRMEQALIESNEKLTQLDKLKTDFLSNVSHELRTPLTAVLGFAKLIKNRLENVVFPHINLSDPRVQRAMDQVMENTRIIVLEGTRLTALINDVLDLAKMEAGGADWRMEPVLPSELVERAIEATMPLFLEKGVELRVEVSKELPPIYGDRDRLIQVIINLLSNAAKFTDRGYVDITAGRLGDTIMLRVEDTGIGIDPADQAQIFDKFKQAGDTLTGKPRGTGLGLPISKLIIDHHGGQFSVESTVGQGSVFLVTLPRFNPDAVTEKTN